MSQEIEVGDRVLFGTKRGVVRYKGEVTKFRGIWCGIELEEPAGYSDGTYYNDRYFTCPDGHAVFSRVGNVRLYSKETQAATQIQRVFRGAQARRRAKEQLAETQKMVRAAIAIQRVLRGMRGRKRAQDIRLWQVWNLLDTKEESELVHTHDKYEALKESYTRGKGAEMPMIQGATPTVIEADNCPRLPEIISLDFVTAMMDHFKSNQPLRREDVMSIIFNARELFAPEPNVVEVNIHRRLTVVGDLHGQLDDLYTIFKLNGLPSLRNSYLFNGDFVDRGQHSVECILVLLAFKLLFPANVFLNRGNHEARDINSRDGFERECLMKYDAGVFEAFSDLFSTLPLAHVLSDKVFVVHGGLTWEDVTLDDINKLDRFHQVPPVESVVEQLLWSDPEETLLGREHNPRGAALVFGEDVATEFLANNGCTMIVRSHECQRDGFRSLWNGKLITVFSASNYCGVVGNKGAFIIFENNLDYKVVSYDAKPKEKMSRYRMRHSAIQEDVISKLLRRIALNRLALVDYYQRVDATGEGYVTRVQWAEGLRSTLKLNIPFLEFQTYLGLPKLGVRGAQQGLVDYMHFLDRYRIHLSIVDEESLKKSAGEDLQHALDQLTVLLYSNRFELESLFRYFDANGDGVISIPELRDGILSLATLLDEPISDKQVSLLVEFMDQNKDGSIQYDEFFDSFKLADPKLTEAVDRGREAQLLRRNMKEQ